MMAELAIPTEALGKLKEAFSNLAGEMKKLQEAITTLKAARDKRPLEMRLRAVLRRMWKAQAAALQKDFLPELARYSENVTEALRPLTPSQLNLLLTLLNVDEKDWAGSIAKIIAEALRSGAQRMRTEVEVDISFNLDTTEIRQIIDTRAADLVRGINRTTRDRIRTILSEGIKNSESYSAIAKRLRDTFEAFGAPSPLRHLRDRAELIAVTEIGNAYIEGQLRQGRRITQRGIQLQKGWLTVGDDRVEEECLRNQNAGWIDFDENFPTGHRGPLAHPGCRCSMTMQRKRS